MDEESPLLIFPYLSEGNLKKFLHRSKISDRGTKQVSIAISSFRNFGISKTAAMFQFAAQHKLESVVVFPL